MNLNAINIYQQTVHKKTLKCNVSIIK